MIKARTGTYSILLEIAKPLSVKVGKLGTVNFPRGCYVYTGSAMGRGSSSLPSRIKRHLRKTKRLRWHIDFLLNANVLVHGFVYAESATSVECEISKSLSKSSKVLVKGFGASDCKAGCASHLHHFPDANSQTVLKMLILTYKRLNFEPHYLKKVSASVL